MHFTNNSLMRVTYFKGVELFRCIMNIASDLCTFCESLETHPKPSKKYYIIVRNIEANRS